MFPYSFNEIRRISVYTFYRRSLELRFPRCRYELLSLHTNFSSLLFMPVSGMLIIHLELSPSMSRCPALVCIIENLERNYMFMSCIQLNLFRTS
jgi:hypothetical protein